MHIDAKFVQSVLQQTDDWNQEEIIDYQYEVAKEQEILFDYFIANLENYDDMTKFVALWIYTMVYRIYRTAYKKTLPEITDDHIEKAIARTGPFFEKFTDERGLVLDPEKMAGFGNYPEIWIYITDILFDRDIPDGKGLSAETIGELTILFKEIVDMLDEATAD
ncbi:MAG: hypothetical protein ACLFQB_08410 [Chitinispirillaceae bacterium]